jgi:hypothetical protein
MDASPYLLSLERLMRRGRDLRHELTADPLPGASLASTRIWQQDCAALIYQLSGGSKAHWLARGYSDAFLVRSTASRAVEEADVTEIVDRIVGVLGQAAASLSGMNQPAEGAVKPAAPTPAMRRFEFVHNAELRPVLQQAFADSRSALDEGDFHRALRLSCGVLEAIVTDALTHAAATGGLTPDGTIAEWSFGRRIAAAERAGLIHGGCARLPAVAREYRDLADTDGRLRPDIAISEREARVTGQVLLVVLRDLDPGR